MRVLAGDVWSRVGQRSGLAVLFGLLIAGGAARADTTFVQKSLVSRLSGTAGLALAAPMAPTPEPGTIVLLAGGLAGMGYLARRKRNGK